MDIWTPVAALAAAGAAGYAGWQVHLTKRINVDQSQPYVYADIRPDEHQPSLAVLVITNTGPTVAHEVRVRFEPALSLDYMMVKEPLAEIAMAGFPPGAFHVRALGLGDRFIAENGKQVTVSIDAHGLRRKPIETLTYDIDLGAVRELLIGHKTMNDGVRALIDIEKHVAKIAGEPRWAPGE